MQFYPKQHIEYTNNQYYTIPSLEYLLRITIVINEYIQL